MTFLSQIIRKLLVSIESHGIVKFFFVSGTEAKVD